MFKECDGITTLGHDKNEFNGVQLWYDIWYTWYEGQFDISVKDYIPNNWIYDNNYKIIDDNLKNLIGVYPIDLSGVVDWDGEFRSMFCCWANDFIPHPEIRPYELSQLDPKYIEKEIYNKKVTNIHDKLKHADYSQGIITDNNRNMKIIKWLKKQIRTELNIEISDTELEQTDWYRFYVKKKESKKQLYLVITNSVASILGMSSYAPIDDYGSRIWQSCQTIAEYPTEYARALPVNIMDPGSLICYVTDGNTVEFNDYGELCDGDYNHQIMMARWMLHLLRDTCSNDLVVALDRAYPNDAYSKPVMDQVLKLCQENGLLFSIYCDYNSTQGSKHFFASDYIDESNFIYAESAFPIRYLTVDSKEKPDCEYCDFFVERMCENCDDFDCDCTCCEWNQVHHCSRCDHYSDDCLYRNCSECDYAYCYEGDELLGYYDDQGKGTEVYNIVSYSKGTYKNEYTLYAPINQFQQDDKEEYVPLIGDKVRYIMDGILYDCVGTVVYVSEAVIGVDFIDYDQRHNLVGLHDLAGLIDTPSGRWCTKREVELVTRQVEGVGAA
jgi:hypothetical protein